MVGARRVMPPDPVCRTRSAVKKSAVRVFSVIQVARDHSPMGAQVRPQGLQHARGPGDEDRRDGLEGVLREAEGVRRLGEWGRGELTSGSEGDRPRGLHLAPAWSHSVLMES
jgi:hypothetical protein